MAAAADYHRDHGHLTAPATTPVGAWLAEQRHLAARNELNPARADALTPDTTPLTPARRTFEETVQLLELFLHREGRAPAARESLWADGDPIRIGAWLAKTRTSTAPATSPSPMPASSLRSSTGVDGRGRRPGHPGVVAPRTGPPAAENHAGRTVLRPALSTALRLRSTAFVDTICEVSSSLHSQSRMETSPMICPGQQSCTSENVAYQCAANVARQSGRKVRQMLHGNLDGKCVHKKSGAAG
ncbi:helicase associated domain-containing protein [Streptomyces bobili]|uniref:helicase associated domain-containing protein n=1 Tax=Streptomyces bobili TaxID=67280 RepID=UPI0037979B65